MTESFNKNALDNSEGVSQNYSVNNGTETLTNPIITFSADDDFIPSIVNDTVNVLKELLPDASYNCRLGVTLVKMAQMLGAKRIKFKEFENEKLINFFLINFMKSGNGKDRMSDYLDNHIFKHFLTDYEEQAKNFRLKELAKIKTEAQDLFAKDKERNKYINEQEKELRNIEAEVNMATPEGLYADAKTLEKAGFGSLFLKVSEFGLLLDSKNQANIEFLKTLYEAYDGKIISKSIKSSNREKTIKNMPVNALLHSDYTIFKTSINELFNLLMATGLARRAFVTFQAGTKISLEADAKEAKNRQKRAFEKMKVLNDRIFSLYLKIPDNAVYEMTDEAFENVFYPYKLKMVDEINKCENNLLQIELTSRELKVLKLAGMFACLNHPTEHVIKEKDFKQAINATETLGKDFKIFMDYKPKVSDCYELIFNFFLENLMTFYNKTTLVRMYKDFGLKEKNFRKDFDEIMTTVNEIAKERGYFIQVMPINNNSGKKVYMFQPNTNPVNSNDPY